MLDSSLLACHHWVVRSVIIIAIASLVAGTSASARLPKRPPTAEARAHYEAAAAYSEARAGVALLIVAGDGIAFAQAPAGQRMTAARPIYSGVKGLLCPLAMSAVEDGRIGLEDPAGPLFTTGETSIPVRVRDLLAMTSGLDDAGWWSAVDGAARHSAIPPDRYAFALSLAVLNAPGRSFQYSGVHASAFGAFLMAHAIEPRRALIERVLRPLGVAPRKWSADAAGQPVLAHGMSLTAEQWAHLGMLMRDDGVFQGKRLFASGRLRACLVGSDAMPAYGMGWWLNAPLSPTEHSQIPMLIREHLAAPVSDGASRPFEPGPADLFAAIGSYDQRMYVVPSRDLVIVRFARKNEGEPFLDADFLRLVLR